MVKGRLTNGCEMSRPLCHGRRNYCTYRDKGVKPPQAARTFEWSRCTDCRYTAHGLHENLVFQCKFIEIGEV